MSEAERIREICASKGIKISKLERDLGFGNGYINPKKVTHFSHERLLKIADYLNVSVGDITGEETTKPTPVSGSGSKRDVLLSIVGQLSEEDIGHLLSLAESLANSGHKK